MTTRLGLTIIVFVVLTFSSFPYSNFENFLDVVIEALLYSPSGQNPEHGDLPVQHCKASGYATNGQNHQTGEIWLVLSLIFALCMTLHFLFQHSFLV